jgi:hypothetical protein
MADDAGGVVIEAQPPTDLGRSLRCCVPCRLVKTFEQFYEQASTPCSNVLQDAVCSVLRRLDAPRCCRRRCRHCRRHCPATAAACRLRGASADCLPTPQPCVQGCENCPYLDMEGDRERVFDCTTSEFKVGYEQPVPLPVRVRVRVPTSWAGGAVESSAGQRRGAACQPA